MTTIRTVRYHDISSGHRVVMDGQAGHMHGHNYRITFTIEAPELDAVGRVMDFALIKKLLCMWLEDNWDTRFIVWEKDPSALLLKKIDPYGVLIVPFNPTAEAMATYLIEVVGPNQLADTEATLVKVHVSETRKCSAEAII